MEQTELNKQQQVTKDTRPGELYSDITSRGAPSSVSESKQLSSDIQKSAQTNPIDPSKHTDSTRSISPKRNVSPTRRVSPTRKMSPTRESKHGISSTTPSNISSSDVSSTSGLGFQGYESTGLGYKKFDFQNLYKDPTINLFNRLFDRETHRLLGCSGTKVSRICLGTMNFGKVDPKFGNRPGQLDENEAFKILDRFVELGGNCIDTADFFPWFGTSGESEHIIGNWLSRRSDRERLVIITKIRLPTDPTNVNAIGLSRSHVISSVENCLRRLQTHYIDLLQIDGWDYTVNVKEIVRILDELQMSGKVRNIGVCDFKGWQLQRMIDTAKYLNKHQFVCFEGEYNLLSRGCEMEVVDVVLSNHLGFIAYSPFKYGFLTDQFENINQPAHGSRIEAASGSESNLSAMAEPFELIKSNPCFKELHSAIQDISSTHKISMQQIALRWVLQKEFVSTVVIGVNSIEELEESMRTLTEFQLTEEEMIKLDKASLTYLPYPYVSIPTDIGRKLFMNTPGPIVFSELSYLTQAITLNDPMFDFGYSEKFFRDIQQVSPTMKHKIRHHGRKQRQLQHPEELKERPPLKEEPRLDENQNILEKQQLLRTEQPSVKA